MACNTFILLSSPHHFHPPDPFNVFLRSQFSISPTPQNPPKLLQIRTHPPSISDIADLENGGAVQNGEAREKPKFRWVEIHRNSITEEQKLAISLLPRKMTKRCKAFMKQIICFSPEKGTLSDLVSAWAMIMKPRRAEWLAVLKELSSMGHDLALEVAELALPHQSFEANVRDYTKIIHAYAKQNRLEDAENTLLAMKRRDMSCDQVILTTMIHMYSKAGSFQRAEAVVNQLKLLGQPLDRMSYDSMIMVHIRSGMPEKGEDLMREMEELEMRTGREIYKALLRAYSMSGDSAGAQRVFDSIQIAGIHPDVRLCGLLINAYVVAGQSGEARIAFENMRKAGIEPNDKCVALLLAAFEKENQLNSALNLLLSLERDGITMGKEASDLLAQWFRRLGVVEDVALVLRGCTEGN
ncbi:hypothetical protein Dimus_006993 [Dionaea muscipula]